MTVRIGINGFGRIGRNVARAIWNYEDTELVAVNDVADIYTLAHLLRYDTVMGPAYQDVSVSGDLIYFGGKKIKVYSQKDPATIEWSACGVNVVIESTGKFLDGSKQAKGHLGGSVHRVIFSAPSVNEDLTVVLGVNEDQYDRKRHYMISNASCTTNALAPIVKVLQQNFGIESGSMTTIHSYTNDQSVVDAPHSDLRRARAAGMNLIPTSTGAAKAIGLVIPELKGKFYGFSIRVPLPNVSVIDFNARLKRQVTTEELRWVLEEATVSGLKDILGYTHEPIVSSDLLRDTHSAIVDQEFTLMVGDREAKVYAWYNNEMGYASRLIELARLVA